MTIELGEVTIAQLQNEMAAGARTAASITEGYLAAIDAVDDALCSVIETNPDAPSIARATGSRTGVRPCARSAARYPDPAERQHRYR